MNEFLEQFLVESRELADQATTGLLALEQAPQDREHLDSVFRAFHTLKGGAGIVDFADMSRAVHAAEGVLSRVRAGDLRVSEDLIDSCLACVDQVVRWLDEIEAAGELPAATGAATEAILARFAVEVDSSEDAGPRPPAAAEAAAGVSRLSHAARRVLDEQLLLVADRNPAGREGRLMSAARAAANVLRHAALDVDASRVEEAAAAVLKGGDAQLLARSIAHALDPPADAAPAASPRSDTTARTLRIDAERVDALVNLTGELIVAKNSLAHVLRRADEDGNVPARLLRDEYSRLERLVDGLQHAVLNLRVLPLRTVFHRFARVVREMAADLERPANLVTEGEDTEADKAIVEMLFEPLMHVVRNAMDHGIESRADRAAAGKPAVADIRLGAHRQGEHVVVYVADDGRGIDVARVREVAAERGIAGEDVLSAMSDREAVDLIFAPGFSTAREVTGLSGRGVGMDAVRTAIERVGGRVTVESEPGKGCTVRFVLPFSAMMTRVMTVESGGQMFGIPLDAVLETVLIPRSRIQAIGAAAAFVARNRTIPLVDLAQMLGHEARKRTSDATVVVVSISGQLGAFEVDHLGERMDVMLKPVGGLLSGMPGIAGTTLLGDGQVLLVLDLQELLG